MPRPQSINKHLIYVTFQLLIFAYTFKVKKGFFTSLIQTEFDLPKKRAEQLASIMIRQHPDKGWDYIHKRLVAAETLADLAIKTAQIY